MERRSAAERIAIQIASQGWFLKAVLVRGKKTAIKLSSEWLDGGKRMTFTLLVPGASPAFHAVFRMSHLDIIRFYIPTREPRDGTKGLDPADYLAVDEYVHVSAVS
ncbi:MAG: hypothetical protein WCP17_01820 [bacterium]